MSPKKSKTTKPSLKKAGTMTTTAATGQEYLKRTWGEDRLKRINALYTTRDDPTTTASTSPAKPKLSKTRTMQNTTKEAKELLGNEVLADTRTETKRRQAAAIAKKALEKAKKQKPRRKPTLKRLGTMAKTANEGKAYIKRTRKTTTGQKRTGGQTKKSAK
ncbi:unnamed protein product [Rotaria sp. Silwood2]|nr:unnamed protein product [Rotaria sp. Silwood2]CAF3247518.1 unnamed protein product [Rotaria sp. Silwood2]CAF3936967.1 unnamed protein product [Rotaria sp. Silwood2]